MLVGHDIQKQGQPGDAPPGVPDHQQGEWTDHRPLVAIIDDEPRILDVLQRALTSFQTAAFAGAQPFLSWLEDHEPDVVVCDLIMPGMSGMELHRRIEQSRPELARRFLFVTGGGFTPEARKFIWRHTGDVLSKPLSIQELAEAIRVRSSIRHRAG
ncbi:MAG: hypothetical protein GMKNLPBB_03377 [Myxococcota bacterium]|nr:hypothetical protein [Myxococcota bacterium]